MKNDARVRYTKMRIREAFLETLREKPVNKISVKELCEKAEINRATFYTHYADPFDLLETIEKEELDKISELLDRTVEKSGNILLAVLRGMENRENVNSVLASPNADPDYAARISDLFYSRCGSRVADRTPGIPQEQREEVYRFIAGGSANLLKHWNESGMKISADEMAAHISALADSVLQHFAEIK